MTMEEDFVETILVHGGAPLIVEPRGRMEG
jgi:hypothetical protein